MTVPTQPFLRAGIEKSVTTTALGNGAKKVLTTGSDFVDQFGKVTNYKNLVHIKKLVMICLFFGIRIHFLQCVCYSILE